MCHALCRQEILAQYAQHLPAKDLQQLASLTDRLSGRDLRDICEQAERHWAAKASPARMVRLCVPVYVAPDAPQTCTATPHLLSCAAEAARICQPWPVQVVRKQVPADALPPLDVYKQAAVQRVEEMKVSQGVPRGLFFGPSSLG